jgi:hypothetical protein
MGGPLHRGGGAVIINSVLPMAPLTHWGDHQDKELPEAYRSVQAPASRPVSATVVPARIATGLLRKVPQLRFDVMCPWLSLSNTATCHKSFGCRAQRVKGCRPHLPQIRVRSTPIPGMMVMGRSAYVSCRKLPRASAARRENRRCGDASAAGRVCFRAK